MICSWLRGWQQCGRVLSWGVAQQVLRQGLEELCWQDRLHPYAPQIKGRKALQLKEPQYGAFSQQWWKCTECFLRRLF